MSESHDSTRRPAGTSEHDTGVVRKRSAPRWELPIGIAVVSAALGGGIWIGLSISSHNVANAQKETKEAKAAAAAAEAQSSLKFRAGMELGALGFSSVVKGISDVAVDKKGIITAKADTDDSSYPKCIVTYDLRYNPGDNSITLAIPPATDAAGRPFGGAPLTTPQEVQARTHMLCAEQSSMPSPSTISIPNP
ncbi:MAG TPA: hypothetical protein VHD60_00385 [Candidatus Saccharimonadales bacterium]|nr:hypothetical protein [Candidatus Saccharimonadales bacterium]